MASGIVGILLAAGRGTRFDASRLKLLERTGADAMPLALAAARNLRAVLSEVIAVARPALDDAQQASLRAHLAGAGCRVVECAGAERGMGESLACGVRAAPGADGWLIALADLPAIAPATIAAVADALRAGHSAAAPVVRDRAGIERRGHPVGFGGMHYAALSRLTGDQGARGLLAAFPPHLVQVTDLGCLVDIDTRADLEGA
jgi:molybdenum cofactor cytidylyltransferase